MKDQSGPLFETLLEICDTPAADGPWQMAVDEALLAWCEHPVFRVFRWAGPQVTFGFFGHAQSVLARYPDVPCTRRWTGGGIVEHGEDFTWSLCIPACATQANFRGGEIYRALHEALQRALEKLGVRSDSAPGGQAGESCFTSPVKHDLLEGHEKIAGGALRRSRAGILYQGSVHIRQESQEQLRAALRDALSRDFLRMDLADSVKKHAAELETRRYGNPLWLKFRKDAGDVLS